MSKQSFPVRWRGADDDPEPGAEPGTTCAAAITVGCFVVLLGVILIGCTMALISLVGSSRCLRAVPDRWHWQLACQCVWG